MGTPSKSAVRKAGSKLRQYASGNCSPEEAEAALQIVSEYRAAFSEPMLKVNNGLRSFLRTLGLSGEVSQRLKRESTILEKITHREKGLDLSRMRDIGGCRVVLNNDSVEDLYRLQSHILACWPEMTKVVDYVRTPRTSGYRAIHIIVRRDGLPIEIQLRTQNMHTWAQLSEAFSYFLGENYKRDGDSTVQKYLRLLATVVFTGNTEQEKELKQLEASVRAMMSERRDAIKGGSDGR